MSTANLSPHLMGSGQWTMKAVEGSLWGGGDGNPGTGMKN